MSLFPGASLHSAMTASNTQSLVDNEIPPSRIATIFNPSNTNAIESDINNG